MENGNNFIDKAELLTTENKITEKIININKETERLLKTEINELSLKHDDLKKDHERVSIFLKVAIGVAVALGISGGFLFTKLNSLNEQSTQLQATLASFKSEAAQLSKDVQKVSSDLDKNKAVMLADMKTTAANEMAKLSPQLQQDIGSLKSEIKQIDAINARINNLNKNLLFIYSEASRIGMPNHQGCNGWWQKSLIDNTERTKKELQ